MREEVLEEVQVYITWRHNTDAYYIVTCLIMELCWEAERWTGLHVLERWWEKERVKLAGVQAAAI